MQGDFVSVGIANDDHVADGSFHWAHDNLDFVGVQDVDGFFEVRHFQSGACAIAGWQPAVRSADAEGAGADVVLDPSGIIR